MLRCNFCDVQLLHEPKGTGNKQPCKSRSQWKMNKTLSWSSLPICSALSTHRRICGIFVILLTCVIFYCLNQTGTVLFWSLENMMAEHCLVVEVLLLMDGWSENLEKGCRSASNRVLVEPPNKGSLSIALDAGSSGLFL